MIIEGSISVKAAILNNKREIEVVYIDKEKKTKDFNFIRKTCKNNNIKIEELNKDELLSLASGKTFGGILASVGQRKIDDFDDTSIFYLDGIEDPFNLGYCMRTLYAFGFKNVLLSSRDYTNMEAQLLKSSAGAFDMLNIKIIEDDIKEIKEYKDNGYYLYGLFRGEGSKDVFDTAFNTKALYMLGGEKRGIKSDLLNMCDEYLYISYGSDFRNSLNACGALDVLATLIYKQLRK